MVSKKKKSNKKATVKLLLEVKKMLNVGRILKVASQILPKRNSWQNRVLHSGFIYLILFF